MIDAKMTYRRTEDVSPLAVDTVVPHLIGSSAVSKATTSRVVGTPAFVTVTTPTARKDTDR